MTIPEAVAEPCIQWEDSVWFSDVDDTLIDTAGTSMTAADGIRLVCEPRYGAAKASEIKDKFNKSFAVMLAGYRVRHDDDWNLVPGGKHAFDELVTFFESNQRQVTAQHGHHKKFSREVFIKRAADLVGVEISPELVHEAADAYWLTLTEQTIVFPDAIKLSDTIASHRRPLFLVTSSDGRLKMQTDGQFIYDPSYSEALKRERIELLRKKGLTFNAISIGDPEDKPHPDFFNKALAIAASELGAEVNTQNAIMLGDSFAGDLQTPKDTLGFGLVVLRNETLSEAHVEDSHYISLGDLTQIEKYLK